MEARETMAEIITEETSEKMMAIVGEVIGLMSGNKSKYRNHGKHYSPPKPKDPPPVPAIPNPRLPKD